MMYGFYYLQIIALYDSDKNELITLHDVTNAL